MRARFGIIFGHGEISFLDKEIYILNGPLQFRNVNGKVGDSRSWAYLDNGPLHN